jgi:hypothetical protein
MCGKVARSPLAQYRERLRPATRQRAFPQMAGRKRSRYCTAARFDVVAPVQNPYEKCLSCKNNKWCVAKSLPRRRVGVGIRF